MRSGLAILGACALMALTLQSSGQVRQLADDGPRPGETPERCVQIAAAHVASLLPADREYARYLALYNVPTKRRKVFAETVTFVCNSLSIEKELKPVTFADPAGLVLYIDTRNYGKYFWWAWDQLAEKGSGPVPLPDPYFHQFIDKVTATEKEVTTTKTRRVAYQDGYGRVSYRDEPYTVTETIPGEPQRKKVWAAAPWLGYRDRGAAARSLARECVTKAPILRADWFINYATLAPAYYDFLGLGKKKADFEELAFTDLERAKRARSQVKGVVAFSQVTLNNRTLNRFPTLGGELGGYYWETSDTLTGIDDKDYLNVLENEKRDASEIIATLPNSLQAYFVTNARDERQDLAVAGVAIDKETQHADRQVYVARNCITCHARGMRPISDEVRAFAQGKIGLLSADPQRNPRLFDLYRSNIEQAVEHDRALYTAAVRGCNGLDATVNATQYSDICLEYIDGRISTEKAAWEVGCPKAQLMPAMRRAVNPTHGVTGLLQVPERPMRRNYMESQEFGTLANLIYSGN